MKAPEGEELARIRRGIRRTLNASWGWTRTERCLSGAPTCWTIVFFEGGLYWRAALTRRGERCQLSWSALPGPDARHHTLDVSLLGWRWEDERAVDLVVNGWGWVAVLERTQSEFATLRGRLAHLDDTIPERLAELERLGTPIA